MSHWYQDEANHYGMLRDDTTGTEDVRGGYLKDDAGDVTSIFGHHVLALTSCRVICAGCLQR